MDNFAADDAPGVGARQTGGKAAVFENGIAVFTALFHQVGGAASLAPDHLIIALPDVGIFGIQIRPGFWPFEDHLVIVVMHVAQRVHRAHRLRLARGLLLVQLNFVGAEATIPLVNIDVAGKDGVVRVVALRMIGVNRHRQIARTTFHERTIIAWHAKHTLRCEIGSEALLAIQGAGNHRSQEAGNTFFHTLYLLFHHLVTAACKRSEPNLLNIITLVLILPVSSPSVRHPVE